MIILPHSRNTLLGAEPLWRTGGLGQDSERNAFQGWCVFTWAISEGAVMSSIPACLVCCPSELLLFGPDRLCTLGERRVWSQLLQPEGMNKESQELRFALEIIFF